MKWRWKTEAEFEADIKEFAKDTESDLVGIHILVIRGRKDSNGDFISMGFTAEAVFKIDGDPYLDRTYYTPGCIFLNQHFEKIVTGKCRDKFGTEPNFPEGGRARFGLEVFRSSKGEIVPRKVEEFEL